MSEQLTQQPGTRERVIGQLSHFFDLVCEAVPNGQFAVLNTLLTDWALAGSEGDLEAAKNSLLPVLSEITRLTWGILRERLDPQSLSNVWAEVFPVLSYTLEVSAAEEKAALLQHVENEISKLRQTIQKAERTKADFISVAAHELKTPLTLVEGYSSMLREAILPNDPMRLQAALCLRGIGAGTIRLREIVDDMIDVSMIDNDLLALTFQPVWLNRILEGIKNEMAEAIKQRRQNLIIHSFSGSNEMFFADATRLYQAFRNLVTNAIKYTPDSGTIDIDGRQLPGFIEVTFTDTGIGIDPADQSQIFEKFGYLGDVALHSSGKTKYKGGGPGLGLPITKGIIEAHGGAIWVESEGCDEIKCPGSKFHVMLPLRRTPPDEHGKLAFKGLS